MNSSPQQDPTLPPTSSPNYVVVLGLSGRHRLVRHDDLPAASTAAWDVSLADMVASPDGSWGDDTDALRRKAARLLALASRA